MNAYRLLLLGVLALAVEAAEARAHFLFIRITPPAEAGRAAEVYFSDRSEAGDPRFIDNIAKTHLWVQSAPGKVQPLKVHKQTDRLRAHLPVSGTVAVVGACEYGVLARPNQPPFLLRYYPKAVSGRPDELSRLQPFAKVPLEIAATFAEGRVELQALVQGKPMAGAEFHTVAADLKNETLTADAEGKVHWTPPSPGRYAVYVRRVIKEPGKSEDEAYEEIREFATLAFDWPVHRTGADPEAVTLFQEALTTRSEWKDFPGFTAHITGSVDGKHFEGKVSVDAAGNVQFETRDKSVRRWVVNQLESIALHRGAGSSGESSARPKPVLRFAGAQDDNPLGRLLIFEGGKFASSYRVKDRQITVVNRDLGRQYMTITVLDNERNTEGQYLPRSYTVQYWDPATGELQQSETVHDRWHRVGSWDLPSEHTMTYASGNGFAVRSFTLTDHQLLSKSAEKRAAEK